MKVFYKIYHRIVCPLKSKSHSTNRFNRTIWFIVGWVWDKLYSVKRVLFRNLISLVWNFIVHILLPTWFWFRPLFTLLPLNFRYKLCNERTQFCNGRRRGKLAWCKENPRNVYRVCLKHLSCFKPVFFHIIFSPWLTMSDYLFICVVLKINFSIRNVNQHVFISLRTSGKYVCIYNHLY